MSFHGLGRFCAAQDWMAKIPTLVGDLRPRWEELEQLEGVAFESKEDLTWRGWLCLLSQSRTQKTDGVGFLHRVFATDGVNLYGRIPQGLE